MRISDWSSDVCSSDLDILVCAHAHRMIVPHRLCGALESKPLAVGAIVDRPAGETFVETRDGDRQDDRHDKPRKTGDLTLMQCRQAREREQEEHREPACHETPRAP